MGIGEREILGGGGFVKSDFGKQRGVRNEFGGRGEDETLERVGMVTDRAVQWQDIVNVHKLLALGLGCV